MKILTAVSLVVFLLLLSFFSSLEFYKGIFWETPQTEQWRLVVDTQLRAAALLENTQWINRLIFHNQDKYAWYPPRIIPRYNKNGTKSGYLAYGMVTAWDPQAKLLTLNSYIGRPLYVRFDPKIPTPTAIMNRFDQFGQLEAGTISIITSTNIPNWNTLFCPYDIVSVETMSYAPFLHSTVQKPLIPTGIILTQRLCKQK